jgi:hypothetical protein
VHVHALTLRSSLFVEAPRAGGRANAFRKYDDGQAVEQVRPTRATELINRPPYLCERTPTVSTFALAASTFATPFTTPLPTSAPLALPTPLQSRTHTAVRGAPTTTLRDA